MLYAKISSATMDHLLIPCGVAYNCGHLLFLWDFHWVMPKTVVGLHLVRKFGLGNSNPLSGIYLPWVIWRERNNSTFNNVEDSMGETIFICEIDIQML